MNASHRDILRRHWSTLRRDLEPLKLLPYLVNVLVVTDEQDVKIKTTREDRIDKLLEILPRRGPEAFDDFVKALQEVQPFLAVPLVQESGKHNEIVFLLTLNNRTGSLYGRILTEVVSTDRMQ